MSPYYFYVGSSSSWAFVFYVYSDGSLYRNYVYSTYGVRPAINISPEVTITGSGTMSDPYVVL